MTESSRFWNGIVTGDATEAPYNADTEFANYTKRSIGATHADAGVVLGTGSEATQLDALQVTENSPAGMSVLLNIGSALVNGSQYDNNAALTIAVAANASGNPRIDTIVLRKSWAAQTVRSAILQGTPAASPVPPTLTQNPGTTYEIPIADIAVANAAVSITGTNITPRAIASIPFDGVYLDRMLNNSGAVRQTGDFVVIDNTANRAFTTSILPNNPAGLGVVVGRIGAGGYGRVLNRGIGYVKTGGAGTTRGNFGTTGTTGAVVQQATRLFNSAVQFLETTSNELALALIDAGIKPNFGKLIGNVRSSTATLNIDNIPQFYPTLVLEISAQSAVVATSELMNIQLGSAGGAGQRDGTATNYYSYAGFISSAVAAVAAVQNLGATAAWQVSVPGSTATAPAFYGVFSIKNANSVTLPKVLTGTIAFKIANTNGNISVINFMGYWNGALGTKALEQIHIVTAAANTLTGTEVNIFGKDGVTL